MNQINENLSKGIVLFTGYGVETHPGEYFDRISAAYEQDDPKILDEIKKVFAELDQLKPDWAHHSLQEAGVWAKKQMQLKHPDLSGDALNALEWTFTWWWK